MDAKEQLAALINAMLAGDANGAKTAFHSYSVIKTNALVNESEGNFQMGAPHEDVGNAARGPKQDASGLRVWTDEGEKIISIVDLNTDHYRKLGDSAQEEFDHVVIGFMPRHVHDTMASELPDEMRLVDDSEDASTYEDTIQHMTLKQYAQYLMDKATKLLPGINDK